MGMKKTYIEAIDGMPVGHINLRDDISDMILANQYITPCINTRTNTILFWVMAAAPFVPAEHSLENEKLRQALKDAREELTHWGWGDFHYGSTGQEQRVLDAIAKIDAVLNGE